MDQSMINRGFIQRIHPFAAIAGAIVLGLTVGTWLSMLVVPRNFPPDLRASEVLTVGLFVSGVLLYGGVGAAVRWVFQQANAEHQITPPPA